jgi:peptidoglycan-associated lipoprotein
MKSFLYTLGLCAVLAGCGSSVKLNDVPVEDASGKAVTGASQSSGQAGTGAGAAAGNTATQSTVAKVDLQNADKDAATQTGNRVIYFDYDSFAIRQEFQSLIETHARLLKADKNRKVSIEGHTDERGGREYNLALGQKRSESVRSALGLLGVNDAQVEAVSFGKEKPAAQGSDEESLAKNRRAEITYR